MRFRTTQTLETLCKDGSSWSAVIELPPDHAMEIRQARMCLGVFTVSQQGMTEVLAKIQFALAEKLVQGVDSVLRHIAQDTQYALDSACIRTTCAATPDPSSYPAVCDRLDSVFDLFPVRSMLSSTSCNTSLTLCLVCCWLCPAPRSET